MAKYLTGYPSLDRPWSSFYENIKYEKKFEKIYDNLQAIWRDENEIIINYYDTHITVKYFFSAIHNIAKSLRSLGIVEGMSIALSLESVPEFIEILLAAELIGCSVKNYIGDINTLIDVIKSCRACIFITHDYISEKHTQKIYEETNIKNIVVINPLYSTNNPDVIEKHILNNFNEKYQEKMTKDKRNISWKDFLRLGQGKKLCKTRGKNILYHGFTSGTSGEPKEVVHSSESILGVVNQLALFPFNKKIRDTWLLTILPPTLVAVVVAMMLYPLIDGKQLILDPYCKLEDVDLEMMHYKPNGWALIPIFCDVLLESNRIPIDYDMSHLKLCGFGAEPMTKKLINKMQKFLEIHNCGAPFSSGYGQSEAGSDFTVAFGKKVIDSGSVGIPLIQTIVSIFSPESDIELKYNEVGEVCMSGPGMMIGYSDENKTKEVVRVHSDGLVWLHTGDYGFMTEKGMLFILGRKRIFIYPDKVVFPLYLENKISVISGVKDVIVVEGSDKEHKGYEKIYLFITIDKDTNKNRVLDQLRSFIKTNLLPEEKPTKIYIIDKKPINHFKTDKTMLKKKYKIL